MKEVHFFTKNNCRVLINPPNLEEYRKLSNVVIDPDLSLVRGVAMEHRKIVHGKVVPMSDAERQAVDASHAAQGVDNDTRIPCEGNKKGSLAYAKRNYAKWKSPALYAAIFGIGACVGAIINQLIHNGGF